MRYVVILSDEENEEWYAPIVEAPSIYEAKVAAEDLYSNCTAVAALDENDIEHMLNALRNAGPNIIVCKQA
jgi:hypothetical protein